MSPELAHLLNQRRMCLERINKEHEFLVNVQSSIVELARKHKDGDVVPFRKDGKNFKMLVKRATFSTNMTRDRVWVAYHGPLVKKDGTCGVTHHHFSEEVTLT